MKKLKSTIILMNVLIAGIVALLIGLISVVNSYNTNSIWIKDYEKMLRTNYDNNIKYRVENVNTMLDGIYKRQSDGKITEAAAKEEAKYLVKTLRYNAQGYFWIDDINANLIAHPITPNKEGTNRINETDKKGNKLIQNIIAVATKEGGGFTDFYYAKPNAKEASPKRAYSLLFKPYNWIISTGNYVDDIDKAVTIKTNELNKALNEKIIIFSVCIVALILAAIVIAIIVSASITKPLVKIKDLAKRLAEYDFSTDIEIKSKNEFGVTAKALNNAQKNVKQLIENISNQTMELTASTEELSAATQEITNRVTDINNETKKIVNKMNESSESAKQVNDSMHEINLSITQLSTKSTDGSGISMKFKEKSSELKAESTNALNTTKQIYSQKEEKILSAINEGTVIEEISSMVNTISAIAEQTNLLALNAAIEAARAGEQGRGFAVVSEEVRKLAEQSSSSATTIQESVKKVQESFKKLSSNSNEVLNFINNDVIDQFNNFMSSGEYYYGNAEEISKISEEIAAMSEQLTATIQEVDSMVQLMASNSIESTQYSTNILQSISETNAGMSEVAATAENQVRLAQKLNELISDFKI